MYKTEKIIDHTFMKLNLKKIFKKTDSAVTK